MDKDCCHCAECTQMCSCGDCCDGGCAGDCVHHFGQHAVCGNNYKLTDIHSLKLHGYHLRKGNYFSGCMHGCGFCGVCDSCCGCWK